MPEFDDDEGRRSARHRERGDAQRTESEGRLTEIVRSAVDAAFDRKWADMLESLGIDASDRKSRAETRKDMEHLRRLREGTDNDRRTWRDKIIAAIVTMVVTGASTFLALVLAGVHIGTHAP